VPHRSCRLVGAQGTLIWDAIKDVVEIFRVETGRWERTWNFRRWIAIRRIWTKPATFFSRRDATTGKLPDLSAAYDVVAIVEAAKESIACGRHHQDIRDMSSKPVKSVVFIFARGGSKGVPGKNIKPLGGKAIDSARHRNWSCDTDSGNRDRLD
jgi:hypothetical protein